ncbi:MAG: HigA family addiction module antitoxin [Planctomycetales bacterium]|nr:HigA family addiction module antitoxin [Planctomycetales bacterium]
MLPERRAPPHPGEVLVEEILKLPRLTQAALAAHLGVTGQRPNEIARGKPDVTSETAWLLAARFGTTPKFRMNLESAHDLARIRPKLPPRRIQDRV